MINLTMNSLRGSWFQGHAGIVCFGRQLAYRDELVQFLLSCRASAPNESLPVRTCVWLGVETSEARGARCNWGFLLVAGGPVEPKEGVCRLIRNFRAGELLIIPTHRNCSRCGRDFGSVGREYVCPACRKARHAERIPSRELSFRQRQIVQLVQQAKANKEIAFELSLTEGTVKEYLYHIFRKLGVRNRTDLALWGRNNMAVEREVGQG